MCSPSGAISASSSSSAKHSVARRRHLPLPGGVEERNNLGSGHVVIVRLQDSLRIRENALTPPATCADAHLQLHTPSYVLQHLEPDKARIGYSANRPEEYVISQGPQAGQVTGR